MTHECSGLILLQLCRQLTILFSSSILSSSSNYFISSYILHVSSAASSAGPSFFSFSCYSILVEARGNDPRQSEEFLLLGQMPLEEAESVISCPFILTWYALRFISKVGCAGIL